MNSIGTDPAVIESALNALTASYPPSPDSLVPQKPLRPELQLKPQGILLDNLSKGQEDVVNMVFVKPILQLSNLMSL